MNVGRSKHQFAGVVNMFALNDTGLMLVCSEDGTDRLVGVSNILIPKTD